MIPYSSSPHQIIPVSSVKIIGLGGAGANVLERIARDGLDGAELMALNTDVRTLSGCLAKEKIQLGANLTKGLGTGGDPELGRQAVQEAESAIRVALKNCRIVFLCTGLGGGTGSGAAPIVTRIAREEGAFVVVFAAMPFQFEGKRRREQAETALNELAVLSNALVTFDNNRMGELVLAKQGIHEAFTAADRMICESIKAVIRLVSRPGIISIGLDDLQNALRSTRSRCLFGSGIASGKDRAIKALRNALSSPLLDQGSLLKETQTVLVHLSGGANLTLAETELVMRNLQKFVPEKAHILFGAAVDPTMGESLSLTLISSLPEDTLSSAPRDFPGTLDTQLLSPTQDFTQPAPSNKLDRFPELEIEEEEEEELPVFQKPERFPEEEKPPVRRQVEPVSPPEPSLFEDLPFAESEPEEEPKSSLPAFIDEVEEEPIAKVRLRKDRVVKPVAPNFEPSEIFDEPEIEPVPPPRPVASTPRPAPAPKAPPAPVEPDDSEDEEELIPPPLPPRLPAKRPVAAAAAAEPTPPANPPKSSPRADADVPKLKLGVKSSPSPQSELSLDATPRGRFEGEKPSIFEGEDLDLPPFLRKKK